MGLIDSLNLTSLDLEDPGPLGKITRSVPLPNYVPSTATGTPTSKSNPGPFSAFYQKYIFDETYLDDNPIRGEGVLANTLNATNLDKDTPYKPSTDFTSYPATNTGTPSSKANPGAPSKFKQIYTPDNTYLSAIGNGKLVLSVDSTNLDVENTSPNGGIPYKQDKDPTSYSKYSTGTPTTSANPGIPKKFNQVYTPSKEYLSTNPIRGKGKLSDTVANTNLDVENEKPNGGIPYKVGNDPTVYPTRTQAKSPTPGFFATSGKVASKFTPKFNPKKTYLDSIGA